MSITWLTSEIRIVSHLAQLFWWRCSLSCLFFEQSTFSLEKDVVNLNLIFLLKSGEKM